MRIAKGPGAAKLAAEGSSRFRRRGIGALVLVGVVITLVVGVLLVGSPSWAGKQVDAGPSAPSGGRRKLPAAPLRSRIEHQAVWNGREVIVAGGCDDRCGLRDAAAYDPVRGRWRRIADLPVGGDPVLVAAGRQVVMVIGHSLPQSWVWDPAGDSWRPLGPVPLPGVGSAGTYLVWTGTEVLAAGQSPDNDHAGNPRDAADLPVARLDLASGRWRSGAAGPKLPSYGDAVWTGSELLVAGDRFVLGGGRRGSVVAYEPSGDRWRELPDAPSSLGLAATAWSGTELLVAGLDDNTHGGGPSMAAALDPVTGRWRSLPDGPVPVSGAPGYREVFASGRLVAWGPAGELVALDPASGAWTVGSQPSAQRLQAPPVWTGTHLILWGGGTEKRPALGGGLRVGFSELDPCCYLVGGGEVVGLPR